MKARKLCTPISHEEWLAARRLGISGTDIAAICGESRYKSPLSVFIDKIDPQPREANEAMLLGQEMEDPIAAMWNKRNPEFKIKKIPAVLQHEKHDFIIGNIDRHILKPNEGVLEIKLVGANAINRWGTDAEPEIPTEYYLQVMWYMIVTGLPYAKVVALLGGTRLVERPVEFDKDLADNLIGIANDFWHNHILTRIPPQADGSEATEEWLRKWMEPTKSAMVQIPQAYQWILQYQQASEEVKVAEERKREAANNLRIALDQNESGLAGEFTVTNKMITAKKFDEATFKAEHPDLHKVYLKDSSYPRLNIKGGSK